MPAMWSRPARRPRACWKPTTALPRDRISVVEPGTDRGAAARTAGENGTVALLAVGAIVPRKGYDLLIAALARLKHLPWRLTIAGDRTRDPQTAAARSKPPSRGFGLADRVDMPGSVSDEQLAALYAEADLFVLPSRFEGYGMAYAEALAHGLPVVGTTAGAIPGYRAGRRRHAGPAGRRRGADGGAAAADRTAGRARAARRGGARRRSLPTWSEQAAKFAQRAGAPRMSGFSAEWLSLREPYDRAARNAKVLDAVPPALRRADRRSRSSISPAAPARPLRAVGPHLPPRQNWRLVDNDLSLLARTSTLSQPPDLTVTTRAGRSRPRSRTGARRAARPGDDLGAARSGVGRVARPARSSRRPSRRLPVYAALSYDGRIVMQPAERLRQGSRWRSTRISAPTRASVRRSGRPPPTRAVDRFEHVGYAVVQGRSDWVFGPDDRAIQRGAVRGCAEVARAHDADDRGRDRQLAGAAPRPSWRRAARICGSVTSTSSPGRPASAERRGRSRAALRRRARGRASARGSPRRPARSAEG